MYVSVYIIIDINLLVSFIGMVSQHTEFTPFHSGIQTRTSSDVKIAKLRDLEIR